MRQNDESAETRAERYEALYKEQRITKQEYELMCDEFLQPIADSVSNLDSDLDSVTLNMEDDHQMTTASQELHDAEFTIIEREVEAVFEEIRDDLEDLRNRAVKNPEALTTTGESERYPLISVVEGGINRVKGIMLISCVNPESVEMVSEVGMSGVERVQALLETYNAEELVPQPDQTPEQRLFAATLDTVNKMKDSTLEVVEMNLDG